MNRKRPRPKIEKGCKKAKTQNRTGPIKCQGLGKNSRIIGLDPCRALKMDQADFDLR
jgi:hypothetical protein